MLRKEDSKIVVAMSGGVDSSASALILAREGYSCVGISMQVWDYRSNGGCESRATCCSPDDFTDARRVAGIIGIPYYVFDFERTFRQEVIDRFVETYKRGETPNPCIDCNNKVKFRELRDRALAFGCTHVATGHYAQIEEDRDGLHLVRGADAEKDQSYFLYGLSQSELGSTIFPVGGYTKAEVREISKEAGLPTAYKPESQDICFVSGTVKDFLIKIGGRGSQGSILSTNGEKLGEHDGINHFTVGQRRGLKVGGSEDPLYVVEIDPVTDTVFVGARSELERDGFSIGECSWVSPSMPQAKFRAVAQLRSRHRGVPVEVSVDETGCSVTFISEWATVSPGQACVFYSEDNRRVLGGGRILRTNRTSKKEFEQISSISI